MGFPKRLKELRKESGCTQKRLGEITNLSSSTISSYELSDTPPSVKVLIEMAKIFKVSTDYLLGISNQRETLPSCEKIKCIELPASTSKEQYFLIQRLADEVLKVNVTL